MTKLMFLAVIALGSQVFASEKEDFPKEWAKYSTENAAQNCYKRYVLYGKYWMFKGQMDKMPMDKWTSSEDFRKLISDCEGGAEGLQEHFPEFYARKVFWVGMAYDGLITLLKWYEVNHQMELEFKRISSGSAVRVE